MDRIDYTKKRKNLNTKRSIKIRERIGKVKYHIEALNAKAELGVGHVYELGFIGKHHRLCLRKDGDIQAIGLLSIEEYLWTIRYLESGNYE